MTENIEEQTPAQNKHEAENTEEANTAETKSEQEGSKTFTEDDLNRIIKDRLERERKKYADYAELKAAKSKLEELEKAKLSEEEKKKLDLEKLQKKIDEKESELQNLLLREKKRTAIDNAKLTLPKDITPQDLIEMIPGSSDDDISAAISKFKKMFPENKSLGGPSQTPQKQSQKPPDLAEQIVILEKKTMNPAISQFERDQLETKLLGLKLQAGGLIAIQ